MKRPVAFCCVLEASPNETGRCIISQQIGLILFTCGNASKETEDDINLFAPVNDIMQEVADGDGDAGTAGNTDGDAGSDGNAGSVHQIWYCT